MSDDEFLNVFSDFLMSVRVNDLAPPERARVLNAVRIALNNVAIENRSRPWRATKSSGGGFEDGQEKQLDESHLRLLLQKIGRGIFQNYPDHPNQHKMYQMFDVDGDGLVGAADLQKGLHLLMGIDVTKSEVHDVITAFQRKQHNYLHYFEFVTFVQSAMQFAIDAEDKLIHAPRPRLDTFELDVLHQIGKYISLSRRPHFIKELFDTLSKTSAHMVTSSELLEFCRQSGVTASTSLINRIVEHFNPHATTDGFHSLSYAQFARMASESANGLFSNDPVCQDGDAAAPTAIEILCPPPVDALSKLQL